jgi:ubiquinone/menaquinone biosynthesis C-methylase UbiE
MPRVDNKSSQKFFDQLAPNYDARRNRGFLTAAETALAFYMQKFPSAGRRALLEIGVGTGEAFTALSQRYDVAVAFDISYMMVATARRKSTGSADFCVASGEALPFKEHTFDTVLCMDVLEHVHSPDAVLGEISRVLAPGGVAFVTTPNPLWAPIQWTAEKLRLKVPEGPHRYVFLPALARELARVRQEIVIHHVGFLVYGPLGGLTKPETGWTLSHKPILNRLGHNQLAVITRRR